MGGFLSGLFWGAIVGAGALVVSSFALDRQQLSFPRPEAGTVEVPGGSEFDQAKPETEPVLPTVESRPPADGVTTVEAPGTDDTPPELDTASLDVPEPTLEAPGGLGDAPEVEPATQPDVALDTSPAAEQSASLRAPDAPGDAPVTEIADPVAPTNEAEAEEAADVATSDAEDPLEGAEVAALPDPTDETANGVIGGDPSDRTAAPAIVPQDSAPAAMNQPDISHETALPESGPDDSSAGVDESPAAPQLPEVSESPSLPDSSDAPEASEAPEILEIPSSEGSSGAASVTVDGGPSVLEPVEGLTDRAEGVETNRLPQAGTDSTVSNDVSDDLPVVRRFGLDSENDDTSILSEAEEDVGDSGMGATKGPALVAFASDFDNGAGTPVLSVILVHQGTEPMSADMLAELPEHVSFAVDAGNPEAADIADAYRKAGREVVMIPSLPQGATPQDVEQALRVNFERVPEAVALMDIAGDSFQSDRAAVQQVVDVAAASGHGLITFPRGLNAAHQQAQRIGVPTGLIFRSMDGDNETQEQIRRTMDRAAFRARQNDGVILVGTTADATLAAVVEWALGNRSASVAIAPVSVALSGG